MVAIFLYWLGVICFALVHYLFFFIFCPDYLNPKIAEKIGGKWDHPFYWYIRWVETGLYFFSHMFFGDVWAKKNPKAIKAIRGEE